VASVTSALLLSGGMDSISIAFWKRPDAAITINYGQRPFAGEVNASGAVCAALEIPHHIITCDISALGSGDMAGSAPSQSAPATEWWPYRNQLLLTLSAMKCHQLGLNTLLIGALRTDGFHADGTSEFISRMNELFSMQEGELSVEAPAIGFSASELVHKSKIPMSLLAFAHSCHTAEQACGFCRGCRKHYETMEDLGETPY